MDFIIVLTFLAKKKDDSDPYFMLRYTLATEVKLSRKEIFENNDSNMMVYEADKIETGDDRYIFFDRSTTKRPLYLKNGNTNLGMGFTEDFIENVKSIPGVKDIRYSNFETERVWNWAGRSYDKMGGDRLFEENINNERRKAVYGDRYLFATEYVEPTQELYKKLIPYMDEELADYEAFCRGEQILLLIADNPYGQYDDTLMPGDRIDYNYYYRYSTVKYLDEKPWPWYQTAEGYGKLSTLEEWYDSCMTPCVSPTVAGVVHLSDEVKEELSDILIEYGYYTAIASSQLGKTACERENQMMAKLLDMELPPDMRWEFTYNQMSVSYDITSSYSATDNILSVYCKKNNVKFVSHAEEKELFRGTAISALLQYGITMLAVVVIELFIKVILVHSRLEARKKRLSLLVQMGAERGRIRRICMLESLRESLWCIFTLPLQLAVQYMIYQRAVRRL